MLSSVFTTAVNHNPSHCISETTFVPWDNEAHENPLIYLTQEPDLSFSGSDDSTPKINSSNSGSDDDPIDDRKRRRMISNRESARRSRMRKQKHLENLINLLNRHKSGNRELMNRLLLALYHGHALKQENERLRSESVMLRQKLWELHQVIRASQIPNELSSSAWPCNNNNNEASSKNKTNRH